MEKRKLAEQVYQLCQQVPKGKVTTYKEIGRVLGIKGYRAIGQVLKKNPHPDIVPCFKIVKSNGGVGGYCGSDTGNIAEKIKRLEKEGIIIKGNKINLQQFGFSFFQ